MLKLKNIVTAGLFACSMAMAPLAQTAEPARGGKLVVATIGEPTALDPMLLPGDLLAMIAQHVVETLYTFDAEWKVVPLIAEEMPAVSEDGKVYTIKLRKEIFFHNGKLMTSKDVISSLKRWTELASRGRLIAPMVESIKALDDYTVQIALNQPFTPLIAMLAFNNSAAIIVPEGTGKEPITNPIGTGPYLLKERRPDQYIDLVRFDKYNQRKGEPNGYGGARKQYLDEIVFVPVPDANTRIEGALAGQYQYADLLPVESYDRLKAPASKSAPAILKAFGWPIFVLNTKQGLMTNQAIRAAAQMTMNSTDMLAAAFGSETFYKVDGALYPEGYIWRNDAGVKSYNQADPDKAAKALKAAGYKDTPVRILTTRQYEFHYKMAQVAAENLKAAGFKVDMQVVDWATLVQRRAEPALWDIYLTHYPFLAEPALILNLADTAPGWWTTPEKQKLVTAFNTESNVDKRKALFAEIQNLVYKEVPFYKVGDFNSLSAVANNMKGYTPTPWPHFWNAWLEK